MTAFGDDGTPLFQAPTDFGQGNGDVPNGQPDFAWTNFGTGNVNTSEVSDIILGALVIDKGCSSGSTSDSTTTASTLRSSTT